MAILDPIDTVERLYSLLPAGWFPDLVDAPDLQAVLSMLAASYSNDNDGLAQFLTYVRTQTRVATASDFWLDLIAADYFGPIIQRHNSESDNSFRRRIILNLLAPRGTRPALSANVGNLTGFRPKIIELRNTNDCGSYVSLANFKDVTTTSRTIVDGDAVITLDQTLLGDTTFTIQQTTTRQGSVPWGGMAYNEVGAYGTLRMPYQLLIDVVRPFGEGVPNVNGYSMNGGGYATYPKPFGFVGGLQPQNYGNGEYIQLSDIVGMVTDEDIYDTISRTMPAGCTAWTRIVSPFVEVPPTGGGAMLDSNFYLDLSVLAEDGVLPSGGLLGLLRLAITSQATISAGAIHGILRTAFTANGFILAQPPIAVQGTWTLPAISASGAIFVGSSKVTLPLQFSGTSIITTSSQPLLGQGMVLPFVLGTVPNAQPLIGQSFIVGQSTIGLRGGVSMPSVSSVCQIGSLVPSAPRALVSVSSASGIGALAVTGTATSASPSLASVHSATAIGVLGPPKQPLLGQSMFLPFTLGTVAQSPTLSIAASGVQSASAIGNLALPARSFGVSSTTIIAPLAATTDQPQVWSNTRRSSTISVSNVGLTAAQTGTSDDAIYAVKSATNGKYYWELTVSLVNAQQITAGIANATSQAAAGNFVGHDTNSLGWRASNGDIVSNNAAIGSWPTWTSTAKPSATGVPSLTSSTGSSLTFGWAPASDTVTVCFALDLDDGLIWSRVAAGPWNGIAGATPSGGGLLTLGVTPMGQSTSSGATAMMVLGSTPMGSVIAGQSPGTTSSITGDPTSPPTAPTNVTATPATTTSMALTWTASTGGIAIPASVLASAVSPACSLYTTGDIVTAAFAASAWQFQPPAGYNAW